MVNQTCQNWDRKNIPQQKIIIWNVIFLNMFFIEYVCTITKNLFININFAIFFAYQHKSSLMSFYTYRNILKIPKDEWGDIQNIAVGMSKNVYKEIVKDIYIIASHEEPYQQQRASNVWNLWFLWLYTSH